jgi:hypothetical protein
MFHKERPTRVPIHLRAPTQRSPMVTPEKLPLIKRQTDLLGEALMEQERAQTKES